MQFQCIAWSSIEELLEKIKAASNVINSTTPLEIERKWIVDHALIDFLKENYPKNMKNRTMLQSYLSVNPEIRYRSVMSKTDSNDVKHYIAYKSDGDLVREEMEVEVSMASALKFAKAIRDDKNIKEYHGSKFITKDYYVFYINDIKLQMSMVDDDKKFVYLEIEFPTEAAAQEFELPKEILKYIKKEVTSDASYKMKNYWKRTRVKK